MAGRQKVTAITAEISLPMPKPMKYILQNDLGEYKTRKLAHSNCAHKKGTFHHFFQEDCPPATSLPVCLIPRIIKLHCMTLGENPSFGCSEGGF